jgi:hypothetical protein
MTYPCNLHSYNLVFPRHVVIFSILSKFYLYKLSDEDPLLLSYHVPDSLGCKIHLSRFHNFLLLSCWNFVKFKQPIIPKSFVQNFAYSLRRTIKEQALWTETHCWGISLWIGSLGKRLAKPIRKYMYMYLLFLPLFVLQKQVIHILV